MPQIPFGRWNQGLVPGRNIDTAATATTGKCAAELAVRLIKRGRKYGIILLLATQSPTKDSLPREVTRNIACGVAFSVADQIANDGLLGSGRCAAGGC